MNDVPSYDDRNGGREKMPPGAPTPPTITVTWHPDIQQVQVGFKSEEFKTWEMVVATLEMAKSFAEFQRDIARQAALRNAMMQAQQDAAIRNKIKI